MLVEQKIKKLQFLKKYVNCHFFSIVVGAGAARRRFVYNAACGYRTGTPQHTSAAPLRFDYNAACGYRTGTPQHSLVTYNFWLCDYLFFDKVAQVLSLDNVAISAQ